MSRSTRSASLVVSVVGLLILLQGTARAQNYCDEAYPGSGYSANGYDESLGDVNDVVCWLGYFTSGGWSGTGAGGATQGVLVYVEDDGFWHVVTNQEGDEATAYCVWKDCFKGKNSNYKVKYDNIDWGGPGTSPPYWSEAEQSDTCGDGCDYESSNYGYPGVAGTKSCLTFLQGWPGGTGATNGSGEYAGVTYNAGGPNTLYTNSCVENEECWAIVQASYTSIFVGSINTTVPVYPYETAFTNDTYFLDLGTNFNDGMCFITYVQGAFRDTSNLGLLLSWNGSEYEWYAFSDDGVDGGNEIKGEYACMGWYINH